MHFQDLARRRVAGVAALASWLLAAPAAGAARSGRGKAGIGAAEVGWGWD